jgi:hypothetical protein
VAIATAGHPALLALVAAGQTSAFALAWFCGGYFAIRAGRRVLAGLVLGSLAYKPTLGIATAIVALAGRDIRFIAGAASAACVQFALASWYFGPNAVLEYIRNMGVALDQVSLLEARPDIMHSLRSFSTELLPSAAAALAMYALTSAIIVVVVIRLWKMRAPLELRYAGLLLATMLVNPHVYTYELIVLVLAYLLIAAWALSAGVTDLRLWLLGYAAMMLPVVDPFLTRTRIQWSVVALACLFVLVVRFARHPNEATTGASP